MVEHQAEVDEALVQQFADFHAVAADDLKAHFGIPPAQLLRRFGEEVDVYKRQGWKASGLSSSMRIDISTGLPEPIV